jgi:hypothetical protein
MPNKQDSWKPSTYGHQVVTDDSMHSICELKPAGNMWEQRRRAYLIAAAPDLLDAAQRLVDYAGEDEHGECEAAGDPGGPCAWCNLRAAIAKAHAPAEISYICENCGRETPIRLNGSCVECAEKNTNA